MKRRIEIDIHMTMTVRGSYGYGSGGRTIQDSRYFFVMGMGGPDLSIRALRATTIFWQNQR